MKGSDMIIFTATGEGKVETAKAVSKSAPKIDEKQNLKDIVIDKSDPKLYKFTAYRTLKTDNEKDFKIALEKDTALIWAENKDTPELKQHTARGLCSMTLKCPKGKTSK